MSGAAIAMGATAGNIISQVLANRTQKEIANHANRQESENIWMQNQYNKPVNQMYRLKEAGLNPNLMYSQGNVGNQSSTPNVHLQQWQNPLENLGGTFMDLLNAYTNYILEKQKLQTEEKRTEALELANFRSSVDNNFYGNVAWQKNQQANYLTQIMGLESAMKGRANTVEAETVEDRIKSVRAQYEKSMHEAVGAGYEQSLKGLEYDMQRVLQPHMVTKNDAIWARLGAMLMDALNVKKRVKNLGN